MYVAALAELTTDGVRTHRHTELNRHLLLSRPIVSTWPGRSYREIIFHIVPLSDYHDNVYM